MDVIFKPSNTGTPRAENLRFEVETVGNVSTVRLKARQVVNVDSTAILAPGVVLTCRYQTRQFGRKYYKASINDTPTAWERSHVLDDALLYPDRPAEAWFDIPLSMSGAELPRTTSELTKTQLYGSTVAADYAFIETPPTNPDESTETRITVVESPRGIVTSTGTISKGSGRWFAGYLDAGARLTWTGSGNIRTPTALYSVYEESTKKWYIAANAIDGTLRNVILNGSVVVEY